MGSRQRFGKRRIYPPYLSVLLFQVLGSPCSAIVFSPLGSDFSSIVGATDVYVPSFDAWVGTYPYLDRSEFRLFLSKREERRRRKKKTRAFHK